MTMITWFRNPENTRVYRGARYCRACDRDRARQKSQEASA